MRGLGIFLAILLLPLTAFAAWWFLVRGKAATPLKLTTSTPLSNAPAQQAHATSSPAPASNELEQDVLVGANILSAGANIFNQLSEAL